MSELWNNVKGPNVKIIGKQDKGRGEVKLRCSCNRRLSYYIGVKSWDSFSELSQWFDTGCPREGADMKHDHEQCLSVSLSFSLGQFVWRTLTMRLKQAPAPTSSGNRNLGPEVWYLDGTPHHPLVTL